MAKKGPSLDKSRFGIGNNNDDFDFNDLLSSATDNCDDTFISVTPKRKEVDNQTLEAIEAADVQMQQIITETNYVEATPDVVYVQKTASEPVAEPIIEPTIEEKIEEAATPTNRKLNFNEIQEPVVWGSNVIKREIVIEEPEEPEPIPEPEPERRRRQGKPSSQIAQENKESASKKEKPIKEPKPKKEKVPKEKKVKEKTSKRKVNVETKEELQNSSILNNEVSNDTDINTKSTKKQKDKKPTKVDSRYPKVYYDPTDAEVDEKDGKTYYYFNIEKTLRKYNLLFITKIIPLYKLEEMTFDNPNFDGIAQKQHDKVEKLNALSAEEQKKYESKNKLIKLGIVAALAFGIFFHVNNNIIPENKFNQATELMKAENYEESWHIYNSLGMKYDSFIFAKYNEGQIFFKIAKESSSGTAGKDLTEEEKTNLIKESIENYDKAKECFSLLPSYAGSMTEVMGMSTEDISNHLESLIKECDYNKARMLYQNGKFEEAAVIFKSIHTYSDATENYYKCMYEIADNYYEDGDYFLSIDYFYPVSKASYSDANNRLKELAQQLYDDANFAYQRKNYELAIENFAFLADYNYLDSKDMINKCRYNYALDFYKAKEYEKALNYFVDIEEYKDSLALKKDCIYKLGVIAYNNDPVSSIESFSQIPGFKNSNEILDSDNLILYGEWDIIELDGNAILNTSFSFDKDGLFKTNSTNVLGVAISTDYTPYSYKWDNDGYKATMDNNVYNISLKIVDENNIYMVTSAADKKYEYKCVRTSTYLELLAKNKTDDITNEESLTLHQKLTLLIEDYVELKTDGKYKINGLLTDINNTKEQLNNSLENELQSESSNSSEVTE